MKESIAKSIRKIIIPVVSAILALLIGIVIIELTGNNAFEAYGYMFKGAFGSLNNICELFTIAVPLILCGLAITFAYKSGVLTIGVDGQLIIGAIAAAWFVQAFPKLPNIVITLGAILVGMLAGALWGAIAGALKAYRNVNEIVSTLLMNYIALYLADYLYTYPLAAANSKIPQTAKVAEGIRLANLVPGTRLHVGIIVALMVAALIWYVLYKTSHGAKFRAVGINPVAANCNGISVKKYMIMSMAISGAIGGLAGTMELLGTQYRIQSGFCADFGFDGIAIALIGQLHPIGTVLAALFFAVLNVGSNSMELMTNVPSSIANIIQAIIIFFVVGGSVLVEKEQIKQFFRTRFDEIRKNKKSKEVASNE